MDDLWKEFWTEHAKSAVAQHPQIQVLRTLNKKPISEAQFRRILEDMERKMRICQFAEAVT